jgi:hypothetical protein
MFMFWADLGCIPPIYASCTAGMTGACHYAQLSVVEIELLELFAWVDLES